MPTYDYACTACESTFEVFHGMNEKPRINCPSCRRRARKQIGCGAGILFRGSGFYQTDYRSASYRTAATAETSASATATAPAVSAATPSPAAAPPAAKPPVPTKKD